MLDFSFLGQRAGFQIAESLWTVTAEHPYWQLIVAGLVNTLTVAAIAIPLATALGLLLGVLRLSRHPLLARVLACVVEPIRNTPVLLQMFMWYALLLQLPVVREAWQPLPGVYLSNRGLALPMLQGAVWWPLWLLLPCATLWRRSRSQAAVFAGLALLWAVAAQDYSALHWDLPRLAGLGLRGGWSLSPELTTLLLGLTIFHAVFISDVVRGGVLAVPLGQVNAGRALGMNGVTLARQVIYPYAVRVAVPPYANQCLMLIKNSTLAIAIGYQELMAIVNTTITQTGRAIEGMTLAMAFYVVLGVLLAAGIARYNAHVNRYSVDGAGTLRLGQVLRLPAFNAAGLWTGRARAALTLLLSAATLWLLWRGLQWALLDAVWSASAEACAQATGACWAVVTYNAPLLTFGTIAPEQRPQAALACALLAGMIVVLMLPRLAFRWRAALVGAGALAVVLVLAGGAGLWPALPVVAWGGLLATLAMALSAIVLALPLAVALALMRRSASRWLRWPAGALVDAVRSIPLVVQLLVASFWIPIFVGGDWSSAKFQLALFAIVLHTSCMLAEVLRGALQAVPQSQGMAAKALGMRPATVLAAVVLPQARVLAAPAALGVFVGAVKDTSLVAIIGVFDVLAAAKTVVADTAWRPYFVEVYCFVGLFYLLICLPLSWLSRRLPRH
ncbi:ABC transporter permease subunit [Acidovorax sp. CCYZU-2555]|uniref:ABC transporter permease subunit n=1 Tax=Acidovorax sp. CCYZU-2555 TaxID=2835042 RepID=UPI001BCB668B|nr:ABC transporter permease subunit [Acidovorax sp. CCYZU-2555]MBS7776466.1 ABC transporter permease subunit [Acidovorax sp. CCYZU-2555]